jgi:hypothetical protein
MSNLNFEKGDTHYWRYKQTGRDDAQVIVDDLHGAAQTVIW